MIRLFVGLVLPEDARQRLAGLAGGIPGARWLEPDTFHITIRFIGEVAQDVAADIDAALAGIRAPAFPLSLVGVGSFGHGRQIHSLWTGVERSPALAHLHEKVERALVRTGLEPEPRKFAPHVTLARLKQAQPARVEAFAAEHALFRHGPFAIDRFVLFSSHLGRAGASYMAEAEYPLDPVMPAP